MTSPEFNAPRPSDRVVPEPTPEEFTRDTVNNATDNFGPDFTKSAAETPIRRHTKVKSEGKPFASTLGLNKKPRSGVRAIVEADKEKIASLYMFAGMGIMPLNMKVGEAFGTAANDCAEAWYQLAKENDAVRRVILGLIEGGAWGKVFAAHSPIIFAAIPEDFRARIFDRMIPPKVPDYPPDMGDDSE